MLETTAAPPARTCGGESAQVCDREPRDVHHDGHYDGHHDDHDEII